jgi:hypothetical protein
MPGGAAVPGAAIPGGGAGASQFQIEDKIIESELTHARRRTICTVVRCASIKTGSYVRVSFFKLSKPSERPRKKQFLPW